MSQLDEIEARLNAAAPGAITITPSDIHYLRTLARKQAAALEAVRELHAFAHVDVEPWALGYRYSGDHCAFDGEHWPCATITALEPTP